MENRFDQMREAVTEAQTTFRACDAYTGSMAKMISGRLKKARVPDHILCDLKKELKNFNMHTGCWKDKK